MNPPVGLGPEQSRKLDDLEQRLDDLERRFEAEQRTLRHELDGLRVAEVVQPEPVVAAPALEPTAPRAAPIALEAAPPRRCAACGTAVWGGATFCTKCGAALSHPAPAPPPEAVRTTCPGCGLEVQPDLRYCTNCGELLKPEAQPEAAPVVLPPRTRRPSERPAPAIPRPAVRPHVPEAQTRAPWTPPWLELPSLQELKGRVTATVVLAWLGGIIATLGLTFLFVVAAQRGWFTPPLRIASGAIVSFGLLALSLRFHRNPERVWAVLAAAGTGIAGLYVTIYAATQVYGYIDEPTALALVAAVAVLGTVVALMIDAQPMAVFAVSAAILAPLSVSRDVTSAGVAFAAVIGSIGLAVMLRREWRLVTWAVLLVAYPQVLGLSLRVDPQVGAWMVGPVLLAALWAATMYLHALRPAAPRHLDELTLALASTIATTLGLVGYRAGDAWNGWITLAAGVLLMAGAALPWALRRPHPDLADLLGAYGLSVIAIATGLLLHGAALTAGWAIEAGALAVVADRLRRRGEVASAAVQNVPLTRADRLHAGATAYLALAGVAALMSSPPSDLAVARWGSREGLFGLIALTAGAAAWAYATVRATRWPDARRWASALPLAVAVYGTTFLLSGEWVIVAWSLLAGAVATMMLTDAPRRWVGDPQAVACAGATLGLSAGVTLAQFAQPADVLDVDRWGSHHGLLALTVLLVASIVWCAAIRAASEWPPERLWVNAVPVAIAVYATPFLVSAEWTVVGWSLLVVGLSAAVFNDATGRWFGRAQAVVTAGSVLALAMLVTLAQFAQPQDAWTVESWGSHHGLLSLTAVLIGSLAWAAAALRVFEIWPRWPVLLPAATATYLVPFALHGEWVVVTWAAAAAGLAGAARWPRASRVLQPVEAIGLAGGLFMLGAGVTAENFAPLDHATTIASWGSHEGLLALGALLVAATTLSASVMAGEEVPGPRWSTAIPLAVAAYSTVFVLSGDAAIISWTALSALVAAGLYASGLRRIFGNDQLLTESSSLLALAFVVGSYHDRLLRQVVVDSGSHRGVALSVCMLATSLVIVFGIRALPARTTALRIPIALACISLSTVLPDIWAVAAWGTIALGLALLVDELPIATGRHLDLRLALEAAAWLAVLVALVSIGGLETPWRLFVSNPSPARGIASIATAAAALWVCTRAMRRQHLTIFPREAPAWAWAAAAATASLWTLTAAILGIAEFPDAGTGNANVKSHFQQGQVAVSITWCAVGLLLLYLGYRHRSRALRTGAVVLLFVTPAKLFLYDLAFLPSTARAASFIVTGLALIGAAFLMQRLGSKDARGDVLLPQSGDGPPSEPPSRLRNSGPHRVQRGGG